MKLIEEGWFQKQIADFAYETALHKQNGEKPVIGVNKFVMDEEEHGIETHPYDPSTAERDQAKVDALLEELVAVAKDAPRNITLVTISFVANGATMGDIVEKLKAVWETYRETPVF